jgi:sulfatase maturation enzyme AslB (radical SAM superfamily)
MGEHDPSKNKINTDIDKLLADEIWKNVEKLTIYGGEPMYSKKVEKILSWAVENNFSENVNLHFFSNGTLFNRLIINKFERFKSVNIGFSIDGTYDRYHIIRWPGNWNKTLENFNKLKLMPNVNLYIIYTYSVLNAYNTKEDLEILNEHFNCPIVPNLLINPSYYAARNLPESIKEKLIDHLITVPEFSYLIAELQQPSNEKELKEAIRHVKKLDKFRNTNSSIFFPQEVWSLTDK